MEDAKTLLREGMERWNAHDRDGFLAVYDEQVEFVDAATGQRLVGREEFGKGFYDLWTDAYPDNQITDAVAFGEGDRVCLEARFTGTHTGVYHGSEGDLPATGKRLEGPYVFVAEVSGGKVKSARMYYDRLNALEQEGIVTPEALTHLAVGI